MHISPVGRMTRLVAALAIAALTGDLALAAEPCRLDRATYAAEEGYTLQFYPNGRGTSASQSNSFVVRRDGYPTAILLGSVIWNNGVSRPQGRIGRNCPADARTDADLEACTYWHGIIYALGKETAALLPSEDEPAPRALLLPDFGRALRYNSLFLDVHDAGDVFTLSGC